MMENVNDEPASDDLDRLLASDPDAGHRLAPRDDVHVLLEVPVDPATLDRLTERAAREGRNIEDVVADAVRAAA